MKPYYVAAALLLVGGLGYCSGLKRGAENQKLAENKTAIKANDLSTKAVEKVADSAVKQSDSLVQKRDTMRSPIKIVHDTLFVPGEAPVVSPKLAELIAADDSTIAAQERSIKLQNVLIASLKVGIALRDQRIAILESAKRPMFGFGSGLLVGAGTVALLVFAVHK